MPRLSLHWTGLGRKGVRIPEKQLFEAARPARESVRSYKRGATMRLELESGLLPTLAGDGAMMRTDVAHNNTRSRHQFGEVVGEMLVVPEQIPSINFVRDVGDFVDQPICHDEVDTILKRIQIRHIFRIEKKLVFQCRFVNNDIYSFSL